MKKELKYLLLLLVGCFLYTTNNAQQFKHFKIIKNENSPSSSIRPNFLDAPDNSFTYNLTSTTSEDYSWLGLQKVFPDLFKKLRTS